MKKAFLSVLLCLAWGKSAFADLPALVGDGVTDDTLAIQARLELSDARSVWQFAVPFEPEHKTDTCPLW